MENNEKRIKEIIASILKVDINEIESDTAIGDLAEWDSIHHLQILMAIEKEFDIKFTPDVMVELEDVGDIVDATEVRIRK